MRKATIWSSGQRLERWNVVFGRLAFQLEKRTQPKWGSSVAGMVRPVEFDTRGIVLPNRAFEKFTLDRIAPSAPVDSWADVANELGYADQAHLTTSVSRSFGSPPATYARLDRPSES